MNPIIAKLEAHELAGTLKALTARVTMKLSDVRCHLTKSEVDELDRLEAEVGAEWDAVNLRWSDRETGKWI